MKSILRTAAVTVTWCLSAIAVFAHPPWGVVVDARGQVYFTDLETVWKIDAARRISVFRPGQAGRHVHELSIDADNNIFGLDNSYDPSNDTYPRAVWRMTPRGELVYLAEMTTTLPRGLSIWLDQAGNTYSVEPYGNERREAKIIKRDANGTVSLFSGGKYGHRDGKKDRARFAAITDMAFGTDGTVFITEGNKVRKIDQAGTVATIYRSKALNKPKHDRRSALFGLDVDDQNNVFVAEYHNRRIVKIAPNGSHAPVLVAEEPWQPTGVAVRDGNIYTLEFHFTRPSKYTPRVRYLSPDGQVVVIAPPAAAATTFMDPPLPPNNHLATPRDDLYYTVIGIGTSGILGGVILWAYLRNSERADP